MSFDEEKAFPMTAADFGIIRELAYQHTGIVLPERKRHMVYSRLSRRLRLLRLANFGEYCLKLQSDPLELAPFINALTTNLTSFFRERHHFNFLETELVPYWQQRKQRRLRVWSAACSSGEEPYSIAMTLAEHFPAASGWDLKILATDLDTNVLARAEAGVYPLAGMEAIPERWHHYLQGAAEEFSISNQIKKLLFFKQLNLLEPWPMQGPFDAIFCRNVLIYFDQNTKQKIVAGFRKLLADDGVLFIGHSESLTNISREFETVAQTTYRLRHQNSILPRQFDASGRKESY